MKFEDIAKFYPVTENLPKGTITMFWEELYQMFKERLLSEMVNESRVQEREAE